MQIWFHWAGTFELARSQLGDEYNLIAPEVEVVGTTSFTRRLGTAGWVASITALAVSFLLAVVPTSAQKFNTIYPFTGGGDGGGAQSLLTDASGNLYGVSFYGGNFSIDQGGFEHSFGTVFKLAPNGNLTTLHAFSGTDGFQPVALVRDAAGNSYGVTEIGGDLNCWGGVGCGVAYKIDTNGKFTVLHVFEQFPDGAWPMSLVIDSANNLYGTTQFGGKPGCSYNYGCGTVFKINSQGVFSTVYNLTGAADGYWPAGTAALDSAGYFYFTTEYNSTGAGSVLKLLPGGALKVLYSFTGGADGATPAGVSLAPSGDLYGGTFFGGDNNNDGVLYKVTAAGVFSVVHTFTGSDGTNPTTPFTFDSNGNLYGTAIYGGNSINDPQCSPYGCGVAFKVTPSGQESTVHYFSGVVDGGFPYGLTLDSKGRLIGGTSSGGPFLPGGAPYSGTNGLVFALTPQ